MKNKKRRLSLTISLAVASSPYRTNNTTFFKQCMEQSLSSLAKSKRRGQCVTFIEVKLIKCIKFPKKKNWKAYNKHYGYGEDNFEWNWTLGFVLFWLNFSHLDDEIMMCPTSYPLLDTKLRGERECLSLLLLLFFFFLNKY